MIDSSSSYLLWIDRMVTRVMLSRFLRSSKFAKRAYAGMYLFAKSISERRESEFFRRNITPGMVILDVGANVGFYTAMFSKLVGEAGRVYAFEPDPFCFSILDARISGFSYPNVTPASLALGERQGKATLHCNPGNRADNRIHPMPGTNWEEQVEVPMTSIDAWCAEQGIATIDAVKMDVQGAEVEVLRGMKDLMARCPPKWMWLEFAPAELRSAGAGPEEFWSVLAGYGYTPMALDQRLEPRPIQDLAAFTRHVGEWYTDVLVRR